MIFYKSKKWKKLLNRKQMIPIEEYKIPIYKKLKCEEIENRKILYKIIEKVKIGELSVVEAKIILKFLENLN